MKKSILTILFALCSTIGFAQVSFQVKAGLNLSSYIGENSDHSKFKPGARIGVGMEYQFTDLISLQPSLFFSQKGAKYSSGYEGTVVDADADVKINQLYLELPINVQFRFNLADNTNLVIATGPYLACGVGGKTKLTEELLLAALQSMEETKSTLLAATALTTIVLMPDGTSD
mgnify:CR=1 FL=1